MARRFMSRAEVAVLEKLLPEKLTEAMRGVAVCMFEALVVLDERAGQTAPAGPWLEQLQAWANQVLHQMQHLADVVGGEAIYFAKGVTMRLSARDRELFAKFRGNNVRQLAKEYQITSTRVRQIVAEIQREQFLLRQGCLPGLAPAARAA